MAAPSLQPLLSGCSQRGPQSQDFVTGHCPEPEQQGAWGYRFLIWTLCCRGQRVPKAGRPSEDPTWVPGRERSWSEKLVLIPGEQYCPHPHWDHSAPPACSCPRTLPWMLPPTNASPLLVPRTPHGPPPTTAGPQGPHGPPCWGCSMEPHLSEGSRVRVSAHSSAFCSEVTSTLLFYPL